MTSITCHYWQVSTSCRLNLDMNHVFTTLGQVLLLIAMRPDIRVREIAANLRVTERTVMHAFSSLTRLGLVSVKRRGRQNVYEVDVSGNCQFGHVNIRVADLVALAHRGARD